MATPIPLRNQPLLHHFLTRHHLPHRLAHAAPHPPPLTDSTLLSPTSSATGAAHPSHRAITHRRVPGTTTQQQHTDVTDRCRCLEACTTVPPPLPLHSRPASFLSIISPSNQHTQQQPTPNKQCRRRPARGRTTRPTLVAARALPNPLPPSPPRHHPQSSTRVSHASQSLPRLPLRMH